MSDGIQLPFCFERPPGIRRWRGLVITTWGWIISWYGFWGLIMVLVIGANVIMVWPILFMIEPHAFPAGLALPVVVVFLIALPSIVVPLLGPELIERGRKMRARDAVDVLAKDRRAPVLYLRSFEDEDLPDPTLSSLFSIYMFRF